LGKKESRGNVVDFHTRHKLLILSHSSKHYQIMGKLVAKAKDLPLKELYQKIPDPSHGIPLPKDFTEEECQCPSTFNGLL